MVLVEIYVYISEHILNKYSYLFISQNGDLFDSIIY